MMFVNGITDKYLLSIEGLCSITKDKDDAQLEVTCKTGDVKSWQYSELKGED